MLSRKPTELTLFNISTAKPRALFIYISQA